MSSGLTHSRRIALAILREVRAGNLADRALDGRRAEIPQEEVAWVQELVYGTFRLRGRIDYLLDRLLDRGVESLEPDVLEVLRLGAYQLLEMGSVPPYAAVSQSVELVRWAGAPRAARLVNGVLQSLRRQTATLRFPDPDADPVGYLSSRGSHPRWLIERWLQRWGLEETRALVEANNRRPELYLRLIGVDQASAIGTLAGAGIDAAPVPFSPASIRISPPAGPREVLACVPAIVQDPAGALVVEHARVPTGARVIDLCAAPGGKAIGMAEAAGAVVAADLSFRRLRRVVENAERLQLAARIWPVVADGRSPPFRTADLVLLDAPCTGTGTLRRHPDGRWRVSPRDLVALVGLQRELLAAAAALVSPGGCLVYSTCSLEREENEDQVDWFLQAHPEFVRTPGSPSLDERLFDGRGDLLVLPQRMQVDGAFAARLRRTA